MTLRAGFLIVFAVLLAALAALGVAGGLMLLNLEDLDRAQQVRYESYLLADELRQTSDDLTRMARTYVVTGDPEYEREYQRILDIRNGRVARPDGRLVPLRSLMAEIGFTPEEFARLKEAEDNSNALVHTERVAMNAVKGLFEEEPGVFTRKGEPDLDLARRIMHDRKYHADKAIIMRPIEQCAAMVDARTLAATRLQEARARRYLRLMLGLIVGCGLFLALAGLFGWRLGLQPLTKLAGLLRDIAEGEGDLTRRLEVRRRDEVAALAGSFNTFVEKLQAMVRRIAESAAELGGSAEALRAASAGTVEQAAISDESSRSVAAAAAQIHATLRSVAMASQQVSGNVDAVASSTDALALATGEIARNAETTGAVAGRAVTRAREAARRVVELNDAAQQIGSILETIDDIASQTNMLALNAAIQAAAAGDDCGEANQGFAVVSREIKDLARQTAAAAREIQKKVEGIRSSTAATIAEIGAFSQILDEVNGNVGSIARAVQEQSAATLEIAGHAQEAAARQREMARSIQETSAGSSEVARGIAQVSQAVAALAAGGQQLRSDAEHVDRLARALRDLVGRFRS